MTRLELDMGRRRCFAKGFADGLRGFPSDGGIVGTDYVACYDAGLRFGKFTRTLLSSPA